MDRPDIFWIGLLLYVRIVKPLFMLRRPYRVAEVRRERGDSLTLAMEPDGHPGFRFSPGQFGWLTVWGSPFRITGHPFSFSSSGAVTDGRVEMTIRSLGDFTSAIGDVPVADASVSMGPTVRSHRPQSGGHARVDRWRGRHHADDEHIRTLADRGDKRPVILLYGSKDWEAITFREELEALKARLDLTIVHGLQDPPAGWTGETGYIDAAMFRRYLPPPHAEHDTSSADREG